MPELRRCDTRLKRWDDKAYNNTIASKFDAWPSNAGKIVDNVRRDVEKWHHDMLNLSNVHLLSNPFVDAIMGTKYSTDLYLPNLKTYVGQSDPESHVNAYYGNMVMMGMSDAIICKEFFSTLGERAVDWFRTLEPSSIKNFQQLSSSFVRKFAVHKTQRRHITHLNTLRKKEGESIILYLYRWTYEFGKIKLVDDRTAINTFYSSLQRGKLYESLFTYPT